VKALEQKFESLSYELKIRQQVAKILICSNEISSSPWINLPWNTSLSHSGRTNIKTGLSSESLFWRSDEYNMNNKFFSNLGNFYKDIVKNHVGFIAAGWNIDFFRNKEFQGTLCGIHSVDFIMLFYFFLSEVSQIKLLL
jgi:hypothetical protein